MRIIIQAEIDHAQQQQQVLLGLAIPVFHYLIGGLQRLQGFLILLQLIVSLPEEHVGVFRRLVHLLQPPVNHINGVFIILLDKVQLGQRIQGIGHQAGRQVGLLQDLFIGGNGVLVLFHCEIRVRKIIVHLRLLIR